MDDAEIDQLAKTIHETVYLPMAKREGRIGVPYERTSEHAKELNRAVAQWHMGVVASILAEWIQTGCDPLRSRVAELEQEVEQLRVQLAGCLTAAEGILRTQRDLASTAGHQPMRPC